MKRIMLFRHAKAETEPVARDHARVLAPRGERAAPAMAAALAERGWRPDLVLCSTARRTRQTWDLAAPFLPAGEVRFEERLYLAGWRLILGLLQRCPDACESVMVIGHNPGLEDCAAALLHPEASASERARRIALAAKFPTAAAALIEADIPSWKKLEEDCGQLALFLRPKDLA